MTDDERRALVVDLVVEVMGREMPCPRDPTPSGAPTEAPAGVAACNMAAVGPNVAETDLGRASGTKDLRGGVERDGLLYATVGRRIRDARRRVGCTQGQLAENVGLARVSITNVERGQQRIPLHTLVAIAEALGVAPGDLLPPREPTVPASLAAHMPEGLGQAERAWITRVVATSAANASA